MTITSHCAQLHKIERETKIMQRGPYLHDDGRTLIVPSQWYSQEAAAFWEQHGFRWNAGAAQWERNTRTKHNTKVYTAEAWLESTRAQFAYFWPTLTPTKTCTSCLTSFHPKNKYQTLCPDCEAHHTGSWR
jgi:hypothetical protein